MKLKHLLTAFVSVALMAGTLHAEDAFINLTPKPASLNQGSGSYVIPQNFTVGVAGLDQDWQKEAAQFAADLKGATGINAATTDGTANLTITKNSEIAPEGYTLTVTPEGIAVGASTTDGLYYAFQTIKKILPANVMAGVLVKGTYTLPEVTINDEPRYGYRGFMLDVSRHFFDVDQVKRMIDVMAYYKMNRFHWHLTDDQGWRIEMPNYPKLTTVGATAPNVRYTDRHSKTQYWSGEPYGPYFYTQDQLREVVDYAKSKHIEIVPEVDMPGHMAAAMTAYPEFSCWPDGSHTVWCDGGISSDIVNVVNPGAIQFAKDVLDTLIDIFPYERINIGGDECPTSGWEANAECQAYYKANNLTNYRALQSHFIKEMADHVATKGRKLSLWNEAITAGGSDIDMVKATGANVYCWTGPDAAAKLGTENGMSCIYTPWGPYYINRKQRPDDPPQAGYGDNDVKNCYNQPVFAQVAAKNKHLEEGLQATFWTEHVSDGEYLEWLALPRLMAVAEAAWTPQSLRDFDDFMIRMSHDRKLLDYGNYKYTDYYMTDVDTQEPEPSTEIAPDPTKWYRLTVKCTDANRSGKCIELLGADFSSITTNGAAQVDRLWSAPVVEDNDYQLWRFEEDPANPGVYAMICKAKEGSVGAPTATSGNGAFWDYTTEVKYHLMLDTDYQAAEGTTFYSALKSTEATDGWWMNVAAAGKGFTINMWSNPADGNSGLFLFNVVGDGEEPVEPVDPVDPELPLFKSGSNYVFANALDRLAGLTLADTGSSLLGTSDWWGQNIWTVTEATANTDGTQTIKLENLATKRCIASLGNYSAKAGKTVSLGDTSADIIVKLNSGYEDVTLEVGANNGLWPYGATAAAPGQVQAGSTTEDGANYSRLMGAAWTIIEVTPVTFECVDTEGNALGSFTGGVPVAEDAEIALPEFRNYALVSRDGNKLTYRRVSKTLTYLCTVADGTVIAQVEETLGVDDAVSPVAPTLEYFTLDKMEAPVEEGGDVTVKCVYNTEAHLGIGSLGAEVRTLEAAKPYVILDSHADRFAYRCATSGNKVGGSKTIEGQSPMFMWQLEAEAGETGNWAIYNLGAQRYVANVTNNNQGSLVAKPKYFTITDNGDNTWCIKNKSNDQAWDGQGNLNMVGWTAPGHPHKFFEFVGAPCFIVTVEAVNLEEKVLGTSEYYVPAGQAFVVGTPYRANYEVREIRGTEGLASVVKDQTVTIVYAKPGESSISEIGTADAPAVIYDLQGRRVQRATNGIYIINGQKRLVK